MSLTVMVSGQLSRSPEQRTSAKGNSYAVATIRTGEGDDAVFASITAFGDLAGTLAGLAKGDPATIIGNAKVSTYQGRDGDTKAGLSITVSRIITLMDHQSPPRPRTEHREDRRQSHRNEEFMVPAGPREFVDGIPF